MPLAPRGRDDDVRFGIEALVLQVLRGSMQVANRGGGNVQIARDGTLVFATEGAKTVRVEPQRMAQILRVAEHVYMLVAAGLHATKRDIYYMDTALFGSQRSVDLSVDDLSCTLHVTRQRLHVGTTCKGLVAAPNLRFRTGDDWFDVAAHVRGAAVPADPVKELSTTARCIVVVEKDCTLLRLVDDGAHVALNCIFVTGRGYPCLPTRAFVRTLCDLTQLPAFVLTDADPHGARIALTYAVGSVALSHENHLLAVPRLEWIGLTLDDCAAHGIEPGALLPCTQRDVAAAKSLLRHPSLMSQAALQPAPAVWRSRLEAFVQTKKKAELQALHTKGLAYMATVYLPQKLRHCVPTSPPC